MRAHFPEAYETPQSPLMSTQCLNAAALSDVDQSCSGPPPLSLTQDDHWILIHHSNRMVAELNGEMRLARRPLMLMQETKIHDVACTTRVSRPSASDAPSSSSVFEFRVVRPRVADPYRVFRIYAILRPVGWVSPCPCYQMKHGCYDTRGGLLNVNYGYSR
jgi:hypothetical protein